MPPTQTDQPVILMTAFEPSGDALGAVMAQELIKRRPNLKVYALGGPKMAAAGVELIMETTGKPAMLLAAVGQVWSHLRRLNALKNWLAGKKIAAHIPIDSPAANWSVCDTIRKHDPTTPIVHLAAPQLWAWAPWRIKKLRRLTNHVLCLMPFEPDWFRPRGVNCTFVGHPMFDAFKGRTQAYSHHLPLSDKPMAPLPAPQGAGNRLALLPGSRPAEWKKNWPTMLKAWLELKDKHPGLTGVIASYDERAGQAVMQLTGDITGKPGQAPPGLMLVSRRTPEVLAWADAVLVKSGTGTLEVAMHQKPMLAIYNSNRLSAYIGQRFILQTKTFTLPNIIHEWQTGKRACTEFVPHFGQVTPVVEEVERLLYDLDYRAGQIGRLSRVCAPFDEVSFIEKAPSAFLEVTGL